FAAGRLAASWIQKRISATTTMLYSLFIAQFIVLVIIFSRGITAIVAVTLLGFFVSIFFPTVYALAIEGLGERTGQASGILNMGFLGSALLPVLQGKFADLFSLPLSYSIAILPYAFVVYFVMRIKSEKDKVLI
ncbi:MAG: hypothetical protein H0W12_03935, partial [Chitinophagaceae bacterium]|nr:hypothetical protein [Chitinophagaceae bacterium]